MDIEITYLLNSGFLVRVGKKLLLFDDFEDPTDVVGQEIKKGMDFFYIFASHAHFDHFNPQIRKYAQFASHFVFGYDIRMNGGARSFQASQTTFMETYQHWEDEVISVESFDSTDAGVSFLVTLKTEGIRIFHAGDFNWWDWTGESAENRKLAENGFFKQMKRLKGLKADVAFFPIDGRLGPSIAKGAKVFVAETQLQNLVTMHSVGYPRWRPPSDFFQPGKEIPVWSPVTSGEKHVIQHFHH